MIRLIGSSRLEQLPNILDAEERCLEQAEHNHQGQRSRKRQTPVQQLLKTTPDGNDGNKLNQKGSLANDLVTDTTVFKNVQASARQLKQLTITAAEATSSLKTASNQISKATDNLNNPNAPIGMLLYDETSAAHLKTTLQNLATGSHKLDENLRALQDNFLLRRYFKKKDKAAEKALKQ